MNERLLVFTESYARGGGNRYMIDLTNAVAEDYVDIVLASNPGGIFADDIVRLKRSIQTVAVRLVTRAYVAHRLASLPRLLRRIAMLVLLLLEPLMLAANVATFFLFIGRLSPSHIIVCNGGYPASQACLAMILAARLRKLRVTLSIVSMPSPRRWVMWPYEWLLDTSVWRCCDQVIVNAKAIEVALGKMHGLPSGRARIVYNGIDDVDASFVPSDASRLVIGCVARLDVLKGVLILLDAFTEIAARRDDVHLVLAGEGDASATIAERVRERKLEDKVSLLGHFTGNVDPLLRSFDIFAFPSYWEGFPYSIVEAMRSERPIVATCVGGIPEAIGEHREGILIVPGDKDALVSALVEMLDNESARQAMGRNARTKFLSDFSLDAMHSRARYVLMGLR